MKYFTVQEKEEIVSIVNQSAASGKLCEGEQRLKVLTKQVLMGQLPREQITVLGDFIAFARARHSTWFVKGATIILQYTNPQDVFYSTCAAAIWDNRGDAIKLRTILLGEFSPRERADLDNMTITAPDNMTITAPDSTATIGKMMITASSESDAAQETWGANAYATEDLQALLAEARAMQTRIKKLDVSQVLSNAAALRQAHAEQAARNKLKIMREQKEQQLRENRAAAAQPAAPQLERSEAEQVTSKDLGIVRPPVIRFSSAAQPAEQISMATTLAICAVGLGVAAYLGLQY